MLKFTMIAVAAFAAFATPASAQDLYGAVAVAETGEWGFASKRDTADNARTAAQRYCAKEAGTNDLSVCKNVAAQQGGFLAIVKCKGKAGYGVHATDQNEAVKSAQTMAGGANCNTEVVFHANVGKK